MANEKTPKQTVRQFLKTMASGAPGDILRLVTPRFHGTEGAQAATGPESIEGYAQLYRSQIEGWAFEIDQMIADGAWVAVRGNATGKVKDSLFGITAPGRAIRMTYQGMYKVVRGKIAEAHVTADTAAILAQLRGEPAMKRIPK